MPDAKPEWDPRSEEDCKHVIRQVLDREPTAGEMMMFTIRLHLERPETIPSIEDAVQRLQMTPEYHYCTADGDERAATRPIVAPHRRLVALPETAAKRAMRDLLAGFPDNFSSLGHRIGNERVPGILQTLDDAQVIALRGVCQNGQALAEQVRDLTERASFTNVSTGQVFDTEGYLMDVRPDLDAEGRAQAQLHRAVAHLAWDAHYEQAGWPVLKEDDLEWWDVGSAALGAVEAAVRTLGPEADTRAVRREAIRLMIVSKGRDPYEIELTIKHLVNVRDAPNGILERVRRGHPPAILPGP